VLIRDNMEDLVARSEGIQWTNKSVLMLAKGGDPIETVERLARDLVLRARDAGWQGPPFNPAAIADLLKIPIEANANVADARILPSDKGFRIQFNPTQARERVRFSIAHELAHTLFPDVAKEIRNRGGNKLVVDDWQLEMLCNLAASEFVMPIGALPSRDYLPSIEELMVERRKFDVSAEAFLIRVAKVAQEPIVMFCASAADQTSGDKPYRIDYAVASKSAPHFPVAGKKVAANSCAYSCKAIGFTDHKTENWLSHKVIVECVGIPSYPGSTLPRVAGLIRFSQSESKGESIRFVQGDVLEPRGAGPTVICQLVNDQARVWGGGVAKLAGKKYPKAQKDFSLWITGIPRAKRLGEVHFAEANDSTVVASLVGQEGFGPSSTPRIRYAALEHCFEKISEFASKRAATVHMPRVGAGQAGGSWDTVEEIVQDTLVTDGISVTVYDLPPKRMPATLGLFD
jgi:O-acetyl-ADP-ribose deacetylase (regulator of RNase III)